MPIYTHTEIQKRFKKKARAMNNKSWRSRAYPDWPIEQRVTYF